MTRINQVPQIAVSADGLVGMVVTEDENNVGALLALGFGLGTGIVTEKCETNKIPNENRYMERMDPVTGHSLLLDSSVAIVTLV
jgi:hypothetical protein